MTSEASLSFTLIQSPDWQDSMSLVVTLLANETASHFGNLFSFKQKRFLSLLSSSSIFQVAIKLC